MYYVYILCVKGEEKLYTGYTSNLRQRIEEHNKGHNISTKGKEWVLVCYEAFLSKEDAMKREKILKQRGQSKRWLKERIKK